MTPSAEQQLKFLQHLQRLFDEGKVDPENRTLV
jgi:hypothetical protein